MTDPVIRIAMWSGPRNISTAMMRSWENRADCCVSDEPLYGHYLHKTGTDHPARDAVLRTMQTDWREITCDLLGRPPKPTRLWYQKHMAHHVTRDMDLDWIFGLRNAFLIRDPAEMVMSYAKKWSRVTPKDLGLDIQLDLFHRVRAHTGSVPPVVLGRDILRNPRGMLSKLCARLNVPFYDAMLAWPAGRRDSDGIWADHWYDAVWVSTGFATDKDPQIALSADHQKVVDQCRPAYEALLKFRIQP